MKIKQLIIAIFIFCLLIGISKSEAVTGEVITAFTNATAVNNGIWIEWDSKSTYAEGTVVVQGITTATVQVRASNDPTKPADSTHGVALGPDITSNDSMVITAKYKWIKVRISAYTSGTITAYYFKVSRGV